MIITATRTRLEEYVAGMGEMEDACRISFWKPKVKRPLETPLGVMDNIKTNLQGCRLVSFVLTIWISGGHF
jgi:hypothetical protein